MLVKCLRRFASWSPGEMRHCLVPAAMRERHTPRDASVAPRAAIFPFIAVGLHLYLALVFFAVRRRLIDSFVLIRGTDGN